MMGFFSHVVLSPESPALSSWRSVCTYTCVSVACLSLSSRQTRTTTRIEIQHSARAQSLGADLRGGKGTQERRCGDGGSGKSCGTQNPWQSATCVVPSALHRRNVSNFGHHCPVGEARLFLALAFRLWFPSLNSLRAPRIDSIQKNKQTISYSSAVEYNAKDPGDTREDVDAKSRCKARPQSDCRGRLLARAAYGA